MRSMSHPSAESVLPPPLSSSVNTGRADRERRTPAVLRDWLSRSTHRPRVRATARTLRGLPDKTITLERGTRIRVTCMEVNGEVRGYLLGCRFPLRNQFHNFLQNLPAVVAAVAVAVPALQCGESSLHLTGCFLNGWREVPAAPRRTAHFHINLLPADARSVTAHPGPDRRLPAQYLHEKGEKRCTDRWFQLRQPAGREDVPTIRFQGPQPHGNHQVPPTAPEPVYLCTVVKDLDENSEALRRANLYTGE